MGIGTWHILVHQGQSDCFDGIQFASYVLLDIVKVSLQWISGKFFGTHLNKVFEIFSCANSQKVIVKND